jgi:hypothetical protein
MRTLPGRGAPFCSGSKLGLRNTIAADALVATADPGVLVSSASAAAGECMHVDPGRLAPVLLLSTLAVRPWPT